VIEETEHGAGHWLVDVPVFENQGVRRIAVGILM
jgi:hypothetical protein